jgi:drug/metabolite transporter (DMT)-like permease
VIIVLSLIASVSWGTSDFIGGTVSKRVSPPTVLMWATLFALPVLAAIAVVSGDLRLTGSTIGWGILAGVGGALGIASLYRGLSTGVMGVVAPISSTSVLVPVAVGLATGESIGALRGVGVVLAIVGVILAGGLRIHSFRDGGHRPVLFALGAALGMGVSLVAMSNGADVSSISTLLFMRITYPVVLIVLVLATGARRVPPRSVIPYLLAIGAFDVSANGLYAMAARIGPLTLAAVLTSLFPVTTLVLARQVHHERLSRDQLVGVVCALAGVVAIVVG